MPADRLLLIIEDDAAFARTLGRSFERRGYTVLLAASQEEAAQHLQQHRPGYSVVDLKLGGNHWLEVGNLGPDGFQALERDLGEGQEIERGAAAAVAID